MKTSGQFIVHGSEVDARYGEPIRLVPLGDVRR
jgi:hypothetical protein